MAIENVPRRVCDRCGHRLTENGGTFVLTPDGPLPAVIPESVPEPAASLTADLCTTCSRSLVTWWRRKSRGDA